MGQAGCLVVAGTMAASVAAGAGEFTPPQGCTLTMTVQQRSCTVAQHYTCAADAPGDQWVAYFTRQGMVYRSRVDAETRWMESTDVVSGITDRLAPGGPDDASLTTLLRTGLDMFEFWTVSDDGERLRHVGEDELTGTTSIDGVTLETTRYSLSTFAEDGTLLNRQTGSQYVSRENGRFYGGLERSIGPDGSVVQIDDRPVRFIAPGRPGFGSTDPQYDCDAQMVRATDPLAAAEKEPSA